MLAALEQSLRAVPMLATLGVRVSEARTGRVVLSLPVSPAVQDHHGAVHSSAVFALGELTAATLLATHPVLDGLSHFLKSSRIKYFGTSRRGIRACAEISDEVMAGVQRQLEVGATPVEVVVQVSDEHGREVAQLLCHFSLERRTP